MKEAETELKLLTLISAWLWGVAMIYDEAFAMGLFAALSCASLVSAIVL